MFITSISRIANHIATARFRITSRAISQRSFSKPQNSHKVQLKTQVKFFWCFQKQQCSFHTSQRRNIPVTSLAAVVFGGICRIWYAMRSPEENEFKKWFRSRRKYFIGGLSLYLCSIFIYCAIHSEYVPLAGRSQIILLNEKQKEERSKNSLKRHVRKYRSKQFSKSDPTYQRVRRITEKLMQANRDILKVKDKKWSLGVVKSRSQYASALPGGHINVHSRALLTMQNDDQIAVIIGHEMAHVVLNHDYEKKSRKFITELLLVLPIALSWAIFPYPLAYLSSLLSHSFAEIFFTLPKSRALENEADRIGLMIAAKACFDVREAVVYWGTKRILTELKVVFLKTHPQLSTHPSYEEREKRIDRILEEVMQCRNNIECPVLNSTDPREPFYQRSLQEQGAHLKQQGIIKDVVLKNGAKKYFLAKKY